MDDARIDPSFHGVATARALDVRKRPVRWLLGHVPSRVPAALGRAVSVRAVREAGVQYRLYRPHTRRSSAALVWIHGGGLVTGSPRQDDRFCALVAATLRITVVSAGYRLPPPHPFPAALDDVHAVWMRTVATARARDLDPSRIALGGVSAGGGLAAALTQRLRDEGGIAPAAQLLIAPMLDARTAADRTLDAVAHPVWNNTSNRFGWGSYLGEALACPPPYAVPAQRGDLAELPPVWIGVGDIDLFHDEDAAYARRLRAAGVEAQLRVVPGAPHGFDTLFPEAPASVAFRREALTWLGRALGVLDLVAP